MVAEMGGHDQAITLANCINSGSTYVNPRFFANQKRALMLGQIASMIAKTGNLVKARNLFAESLQTAQQDPDVARSQVLADTLGWGESYGLEKYNKVLVEMSFLAAHANLVDQAIQIARSIKSESLQAETLAKINSIVTP